MSSQPAKNLESRTPTPGLITFEAPSITLREAYQLYLHDQPPVAPRSVDDRLTALAHWERLTGDLPLPLPVSDEADDRQRHAAFRQAMHRAQKQLAEEIASSTVNKYFHRTLNALFHRLSPESYSNPDGVGLITRVYKFRKLPESKRDPRPIDDEKMARLYAAAGFARWPRASKRWPGYGIDPPDWWQAVLVFEYNLGLRTGDFLDVRIAQIDLEAGTLKFTADKTEKERRLPLHPIVVEHLKRIWPGTAGRPERTHLFPAPKTKGARMDTFRLIQRWARVHPPEGSKPPYYQLKDLRSTCGTGLFGLSPSAAQQMLGHSSIRITESHYTDMAPELVKHAHARQQPAAFLGDDRPDDEPPPLKLFAG